MDFIKTEEFNLFIIPFMIFGLRVLDVSLGTIRIIFVSKGYTSFAPFIGFVEILIWVFAVSRIMDNLNNWIFYIAYAGGFAAGTYVGMVLEKKLAIGHELIRIITQKDATDLIFLLKEKGFRITSVKAEGGLGPVSVLYVITKRKFIEGVIKIIKIYNPHAIYTIEDIRAVSSSLIKSHIAIKRK